MVLSLGARAKLPGEMRGEDVELIACHDQTDEMAPYERLLGDAMQGDQMLFAREDSVDEAWRVVEPVLGNATPLYQYESGTWDQLRPIVCSATADGSTRSRTGRAADAAG